MYNHDMAKLDQQFFVAGKAFIEKDGKLLTMHSDIFGLDLPGGKMQEGEEDIISALHREVFEETGYTIEVGEPFCTWVFEIPIERNHPGAGKKVFSIGFRCKWVKGELRLSKEHSHCVWVDKNDYSQLSEESKIYKCIERYFNHA